MQVKLVVVAGTSKSGEITVKPPMTFGRSRDADLTLRHALISRKHCEISESNGQLIVRDLGSLNGTFVGGQRINEAPLRNGDELIVGSVTFRVQISGAETADAAVQGPIPQGVDPETGLQFLEPVDAVETVPVEQFQAIQQQAAESVQSEPDQPEAAQAAAAIAGVIDPDNASTEQPGIQTSEPAAAASQSEVAFDLSENASPAPDTDDSALGSFLKKL